KIADFFPAPNQSHSAAIHQHLRGAGTRVVIRRQRHSVRSRVQHGEQVAFLWLRELAIAREKVAGFANGPDHIKVIKPTIFAPFYWHNRVIRAVERWADQVVHGGIDYREALTAIPLHIDHARHY